MTTINNLKKITNEQIKYNNFAEEVTILSETKLHTGYSTYEVIDSNGVTHHAVPGNSGISETGIMGYVRGDRQRPTLMGAGTKTNETTGTTQYTWDIQLIVTDASSATDTETKEGFVTVDAVWPDIADIS